MGISTDQDAAEGAAHFSYNPSAEVYVNGRLVKAEVEELERTEVAMIPSAPEHRAMAHLMAVIGTGQEFCVRDPEKLDDAPPGPSKDGYLQCETSGSTGRPKRVRRSQATWLRSFAADRSLWHVTAEDRIAVIGSLHHSLPLYAVVMALCLGTHLHVIAAPRPDNRMQFLAAAQPSLLYCTPSQLRQLHEAMPERSVSGLRHVFIGGGFLDDASRTAAAALFPGATLHGFYGATETSYVTIVDGQSPDASVGRAYPGVEIEIRDDEGEPRPAGERGEIWVRSPYLFSEYALGQSKDTIWRDDWLSVGEIGSLDLEGNLYLAGRRNRMFTVADRNVYPEGIEQFLLTLPGVTQSAVLPEKDTLRGAVPVCFLAGEGVDVDTVLRRCRQAFGTQEAPRRAVLLEAWPTLSAGKTDLRALAALLDNPA